MKAVRVRLLCFHKSARRNWRDGTELQAQEETNGREWEVENGPDRMGVSNGGSIIDYPGNCELAATAENELCRMASPAWSRMQPS
jgi:hypothetical protein